MLRDPGHLGGPAGFRHAADGATEWMMSTMVSAKSATAHSRFDINTSFTRLIGIMPAVAVARTERPVHYYVDGFKSLRPIDETN